MAVLSAITGFVGSLFSGGKDSTLSTIATEMIDTVKEEAEAKSMVLKAIDPNGQMRLEISRKVTNMYIFFVFIMLVIITSSALHIGDTIITEEFVHAINTLFETISYAFIAIITASFSVHWSNNLKEMKKG
ncbi:MAG: hypothetical protein GXO26_00905 [Crenarchaeota archaeon]|nr:hypothetical protein [Thermoproteota archaeon]